MKLLRVALRVVSFQLANALPSGNVMVEMEWTIFLRSECRWPWLCWPQWVVASEGHLSASSQVSKWRGVRQIPAERVTKSVRTEPEPPKLRQFCETR